MIKTLENLTDKELRILKVLVDMESQDREVASDVGNEFISERIRKAMDYSKGVVINEG
ncbi:MAG: hypothetical protein KBT03_00295 [Bacteroidales bacterium]|nr:hypothetical protein [Candidatus Scybalousia scybalohippi]